MAVFHAGARALLVLHCAVNSNATVQLINRALMRSKSTEDRAYKGIAPLDVGAHGDGRSQCPSL
jgi:hypothetical protein